MLEIGENYLENKTPLKRRCHKKDYTPNKRRNCFCWLQANSCGKSERNVSVEFKATKENSGDFIQGSAAAAQAIAVEPHYFQTDEHF